MIDTATTQPDPVAPYEPLPLTYPVRRMNIPYQLKNGSFEMKAEDCAAWMCPISGIWVAKDNIANQRQRVHVESTALENTAFRNVMYDQCRKSYLLWINLFGWTYRPKMWCADGLERGAGTQWIDGNGIMQYIPDADTPIITWPAQDITLDAVYKGFTVGGTIVIDKSREQGATVICIGVIQHAWQFMKRFTCLEASRTSSLVDSTGKDSDGVESEDSLFGKHDYMIAKQPQWMVPHKFRRVHGDKPQIGNPITKSNISGESSNDDLGQSQRKTVMFVDEVARFPKQKTLMKSIDSVGLLTLFVSTPNGPGTEFSKLVRRAETPEGRKAIKLLRLGYEDSPTHGKGRKWTIDSDGAITGKANSGYWETPAFKTARIKLSPRDWRENWLRDHDTSGLTVLDSVSISRLRPGCRRPVIGTLNHESLGFSEIASGRLNLWCEMEQYFSRGVTTAKRPSIMTNYVIGCDFAQGVEKSNTVLAVMDCNNGNIVAEYVDPMIQPHDAAHVAMAMGKFFGGHNGHAFVIWETNGPGMSFGPEMRKHRYPSLYYQRVQGQRTEKKTRSYGWNSTKTSKEILFGKFDNALRSGDFKVFSEEGLDDMSEWLFDENGRIVAGGLRDETTGAQERHGDRAIAYALCNMGRNEAPTFFEEREKTAPKNPYSAGSILGTPEEAFRK
tara:strand:- start:50852 stop:52867 length:2016 start_codon:yes stop_codon:yes gene_type:complete